MTSTVLNVIVALASVLLLIIGLGLALRRFAPAAGPNGALLQVHASLALGGRERLLLVQAGPDYLLLGVSPGRVQTLHTLPPEAIGELLQANPRQRGSAFAAILQNMAGRA
jgi:flagellar protein FliO/FliZ